MSPLTPERAPLEARRRAEAARASGEYGDAAEVSVVVPPPPRDAMAKLHDWAFIEPDLGQVRSTRRLGAPITAVKRLLLRLLLQYRNQLEGEQTRFNVQLVSYIAALEHRVVALEKSLDEQRRPPGEPRP